MVAHVVPLAATVLSAGTLGFVGSLVVFLLYKDRGPFVRQQRRQLPQHPDHDRDRRC